MAARVTGCAYWNTQPGSVLYCLHVLQGAPLDSGVNHPAGRSLHVVLPPSSVLYLAVLRHACCLAPSYSVCCPLYWLMTPVLAVYCLTEYYSESRRVWAEREGAAVAAPGAPGAAATTGPSSQRNSQAQPQQQGPGAGAAAGAGMGASRSLGAASGTPPPAQGTSAGPLPMEH